MKLQSPLLYATLSTLFIFHSLAAPAPLGTITSELRSTGISSSGSKTTAKLDAADAHANKKRVLIFNWLGPQWQPKDGHSDFQTREDLITGDLDIRSATAEITSTSRVEGDVETSESVITKLYKRFRILFAWRAPQAEAQAQASTSKVNAGGVLQKRVRPNRVWKVVPNEAGTLQVANEVQHVATSGASGR